MTIVNLEDVWKITAERKEINDLPFDEIEWRLNGEKVEIAQGRLDNWLGLLNNMDFITSGEYLRPWCGGVCPNKIEITDNPRIDGSYFYCPDCKVYTYK